MPAVTPLMFFQEAARGLKIANRVLHREHLEISAGTLLVVQTSADLHFAHRLPCGFLVRETKRSRMSLFMRRYVPSAAIRLCLFFFSKRFMISPSVRKMKGLPGFDGQLYADIARGRLSLSEGPDCTPGIGRLASWPGGVISPSSLFLF